MSVGPLPVQIRSLRLPTLGLALMLASGLASPALLAQAGEAPAKATPTQSAPKPVQSKERAPSQPSALPDPPKPKRTTRHTTRHESQEEAQKYIRERRGSQGGKPRQAPRLILPHPKAGQPAAPHPTTPHPAAPHPPVPHPSAPK